LRPGGVAYGALRAGEAAKRAPPAGGGDGRRPNATPPGGPAATGGDRTRPLLRRGERMLRRNSRRSGVVAPNMATIDSAALEQVLTSIELQVGHIRRVELKPGALVPLSPGAVWLVFVAAGNVHG